MVNSYLEIFLKRKGLKCTYAEKVLFGCETKKLENKKETVQKENIQDNNTKGGASVLSTMYNAVAGNPPEYILSRKITEAITTALYNASVQLANGEKGDELLDKRIEEDIENIKKLVIQNQIDMNYGGGFLIFDSKFNIKELMYLGFTEDKTPMYGLEPIQPNMTNNTINTILHNSMKEYDSETVADELFELLQ